MAVTPRKGARGPCLQGGYTWRAWQCPQQRQLCPGTVAISDLSLSICESSMVPKETLGDGLTLTMSKMGAKTNGDGGQGMALEAGRPKSVLVESRPGCVTLGKLPEVSEPRYPQSHCGYNTLGRPVLMTECNDLAEHCGLSESQERPPHVTVLFLSTYP